MANENNTDTGAPEITPEKFQELQSSFEKMKTEFETLQRTSQQQIEAANKRAKEAQDEAAKLRLNSKGKLSNVDQEYKSLYEELSTKLAKREEKIKNANITTALTSALAKSVAPDKMKAALQLVSKDLIEYDPDTEEVKDVTVTAAIQKLKADHAFLFGTTVNKTDVKTPASGTTEGKTITISERDELVKTAEGLARYNQMKKDGYKLVND